MLYFLAVVILGIAVFINSPAWFPLGVAGAGRVVLVFIRYSVNALLGLLLAALLLSLL